MTEAEHSRDAPGDETAELSFLRSPSAIRQRCEAIYARCLRGGSEHWSVDERRIGEVAERVVRISRDAHPDVRRIPYHSRWRHFAAGGGDRVRQLDARLDEATRDERLAARVDLTITSVLLDAGAGPAWKYRDRDGGTYTRSEGLAVASYDLFVSGALSAVPGRAPLRADGEVLRTIDRHTLESRFQVSDENPLVGVDGRATVLRRLGERVSGTPSYFAHPEQPAAPPRVGNLALHLARGASGGELTATAIFRAVLDALAPIWPGRETLAGENLGDVWTHPAIGRVPLHKLSQWLTYSLFEPLEWWGLRVVGVEALTGLAEYRNGGLFVDGEVLVPKHVGVLRDQHEVASDIVVEWRALTVSLLDRTAERMRALLGLSPEELPLARVLEGGTWNAGRAIAAEKRVGGVPPIRLRSDGTVF